MASAPVDRSQRFGELVDHDEAFAPGDWALFVGIAVIWGSSFLLIAIGLESLHPGLITFLRVFFGAITLSVISARSQQSRSEPKKVAIAAGDRPRLLVLSVVWTAIPFTLFPLAEQHINSAVTGLLNGSTPMFTALVAAVFLGKLPRGPQLLGIAIGFIGVMFISLPSLSEGSTQALGVALVLAATVCYGFAINLAGPLQQRYGSIVVMERMLLIATLWTLPYGIWGLRSSSFELGPVLAVLALGVVGTGAAFLIMGSLVGRVGSTRASFITYLIPGISLALGVIFQGDEVALLAIVGVILVIVGALLAGRKRAVG